MSETSTLFCPIRKSWVTKTREEKFRHEILLFLIEKQHYPAHTIVIEKAINQLPGIRCNDSIPKRRIDLLCYGQIKGSIRPLLLIECKAVPISEKFVRQVQGYNHFIGADLIALMNESSLKLFSSYEDHPFVTDQLPAYQDLCHWASGITR